MKEEIKKIIDTFEADGLLVGNALKSGQLLNPQAELTEPDPDILCEYGRKIPMSEGFSVTANIGWENATAWRDDHRRIPLRSKLTKPDSGL